MATTDLLSFVRGEADWHAIAKAGVSVTFHHDRVEIHSPFPEEVQRVEALDVIHGLRKLVIDPQALRRWAQILLGADLFDFEPLESTHGGDDLLGVIWDVAFGRVPTTGEIDVLHRRIVSGTTR